MSFNGIAHPEQLKILTTVLDEYCRAHDIRPGTPAHQDAACHIMALFNAGVLEPEKLVHALQTSSPCSVKRYG
jgi:hypothetical protein